MTKQDNETIKKWLGNFVEEAVPQYGSVVFKFHRGDLTVVEVRQSVQVKVQKSNNTLEKNSNNIAVNKTERS